MKRILAILIALVLLASLLAVPAFAQGESFEYSVEITADGRTVEDLTTLPNGTEVIVTVFLTRTDLGESERYNAWGLELDINDFGLNYVSGNGFAFTYKGRDDVVEPSEYAVGGATGTGTIRFYKVTLNSNNGFTLDRTVSVSATYVVSDKTVAQVSVPAPIIYLEGQSESTEVKPAEPVAPIVVPAYVITLDAAGGELPGAAVIEVEKGNSIILPEPVYEGYVFEGWSDGTDTFAGGTSYTPAGNVTLSAVWSPEGSGQPAQYTVTLDANGGEIEGDTSVTAPKDTMIELPTATFEGFTLEGWSDRVSVYPANASYKVDKDITLTAVWKKNGQSGSSDGITVRILDPDSGITAAGERDSNGIVTVSATNDSGEPVSVVPGGMILTIEDAGIGNVAAIISPSSGKVLDIVEKSYIENGTAYMLLDGPATVRIIDNAKRFADVSVGQWFNSAVVFASSHELFQGVSATEFAPGKEMTRGMLVTVLWRLEGKPAGTGTRFNDVPDGLYYSEAVRWAAGVGVVNGYGDGSFLPDENITREQLAAVFYRYMNYLGYDTSARAGINMFSDGAKVSGWAVESMRWSVAEGIVTGRADGTIDPQGNATRAEVATLVMRIVKAMVK